MQRSAKISRTWPLKLYFAVSTASNRTFGGHMTGNVCTNRTGVQREDNLVVEALRVFCSCVLKIPSSSRWTFCKNKNKTMGDVSPRPASALVWTPSADMKRQEMAILQPATRGRSRALKSSLFICGSLHSGSECIYSDKLSWNLSTLQNKTLISSVSAQRRRFGLSGLPHLFCLFTSFLLALASMPWFWCIHQNKKKRNILHNVDELLLLVALL